MAIEKDFSGKRIDLFGKYDALKVAMETCVSTIHTEYLNVQKDMDKCDCLIIVCPDRRTKGKLEKEIYKKILPDREIRICIFPELLNNTDEIVSSLNKKIPQKSQ